MAHHGEAAADASIYLSNERVDDWLLQHIYGVTAKQIETFLVSSSPPLFLLAYSLS
jgi:hypothetical protein